MWAGVAVGGGVRHLPTVLYATVLREVVTSTLGGGVSRDLAMDGDLHPNLILFLTFNFSAFIFNSDFA